MSATDTAAAAEGPSEATSAAASARASATSEEPGSTPGPTAAPKSPVANRLNQDSRRKLLGRIAATATQRELREIQSEVIDAYLGMVIRRTGADATVEQVRDAARARLRLLEPSEKTSE